MSEPVRFVQMIADDLLFQLDSPLKHIRHRIVIDRMLRQLVQPSAILRGQRQKTAGKARILQFLNGHMPEHERDAGQGAQIVMDIKAAGIDIAEMSE